jgi:hypothetical protein
MRFFAYYYFRKARVTPTECPLHLHHAVGQWTEKNKEKNRQCELCPLDFQLTT